MLQDERRANDQVIELEPGLMVEAGLIRHLCSVEGLFEFTRIDDPQIKAQLVAGNYINSSRSGVAATNKLHAVAEAAHLI